MRNHCRHPVNAPFEYTLVDVVFHKTEYLTNVSMGGLAFRSKVYIQEGTRIKIHIPIREPVFKEVGEVVWCNRVNGQYCIGVKFLSMKSRLQARMFQQACFIEQYKRDVFKRRGRRLSSEEAAIEWIDKYARYFHE